MTGPQPPSPPLSGAQPPDEWDGRAIREPAPAPEPPGFQVSPERARSREAIHRADTAEDKLDMLREWIEDGTIKEVPRKALLELIDREPGEPHWVINPVTGDDEGYDE